MVNLSIYRDIVETFHERLNKASEAQASMKLAEDQWSLKEIIGHLIDSASNNHQRFVRLQFGDLLDFPVYDPEPWIQVQKYRSMNWSNLVSLWYNYNCLLLNIIENMDESSFRNVWVKGEEAIPLNELIELFFKHMELHKEHYENRLKEVEVYLRTRT